MTTDNLPARVANLPAVTAPPSPAEWTAMKQQAAVIARSGLAPKSVSTPEKVLVIALKGRELNIPPMQALSHIHIVEGKPTLSAELMTALVRRAGHKLRVVEWSDEGCTIEGMRLDDPGHWQRTSFTREEARRAGLLGKSVWQNYLQAMLFSRATSKHCRSQFADVLMGASYTPEELGAEVDEEGQVVSAPAEPVRGRSPGPAEETVEEPVEEAEVVEEEPPSPAEAHDDEHGRLMGEVHDLLQKFPEGEGPDAGELRDRAAKGRGSAQAVIHDLKRRLGENGGETRSANGGNGGGNGQKGELPATKKQLNYLEALVADVVEDGVGKFEEMMGKPIGELTREEASEWIVRLSGRAS